MDEVNARSHAGTGIRPRNALVRACLALLLGLTASLAAVASAESAPPSPTPTPTATATATAPSQIAMTPTPAATRAPTATPSPTPSPTPVPAQDVAVVFFNNFCDLGQPLMATVFNTSATPLKGRNVRLRLSGESGVLEEHDHYLSLGPLASVNLPLANTAQPPRVKIEIILLDAPADPNPNNDSSSCGVPAAQSDEPAPEPTKKPGGRALPAGGASGGDGVSRQAAAAAPTALPQATRGPTRAQTNNPQPSLTPIGSAGGGLAPQGEGGLLPSSTLMLAGVVFLTGGTSWAFYYFTRPPRNV
jgi:hypothetical protein